MDLILINGKIRTMDKYNPQAEAVAIKDGRIEAVGPDEEILKFKTDNTKVVNLEGRLALPGFNDSHMHLLNYAASLLRVNLAGIKSIDELISRTRAFINEKDKKPGEWVLGRGWNHDHFNIKKFPTRYDLDKISTELPVCLSRACGHVIIANSKALEIAGITKNTPQVEGGHFDTDESGEPLGIFREKALNLILGSIPEPTLEEIKSMLLTAAVKANAQGITSVQSDDLEAVTSEDFQKVIFAYRELVNEKRLTLRVNEQCLLPNINKLNKFLNMSYRTGHGNDMFKIGPVKLLADGSLGARTACLREHYEDDTSTTGIPVYSQEELDELVITSHNAGMQVAVHCIGDKAMYMAFESFEKAQRQNPREDARHSVVHCQITDEALLDKFKELNIVAHIQPIFLDYDLHIVEDRIGHKRAKTSYNWKSLINRGVHIACGSDCPVEPFDVLPGIYSAVTRKDLKGYPEGGWLPDQKLTVDEAVYAFTLGSAYASFDENIKGSIIPGKLADIAVLSHDIYSINPDKIKDVKVEMTIFNGEIVYQRIQSKA